MSEGNTDPASTDPTVGQRIKFLRTRRGMSREVLGGLVGKSARWVKAVESGQIQQPKLPMLISLAEALKVRDLSVITGGRAMPVTMFGGPGHPALPAVREAINSVAVSADGPPPPLNHLQARIDAAWRARHAAPDHRTVLGALLPDLIRDARHAVRAYRGAERRRAYGLLAGAYNLAQFFLAYQPDAGLLWRVAERSVMAAEESEDPRVFGGAVWLMGQAHRDTGDFDAAEAVNREGLEVIKPHMQAPDADLLAMWGALHHEMAYTAARTGQSGAAWHWWKKADKVATALPENHYDLMTSFSRVIMGAHAVTIAVELRQAGESVRQSVQSVQAAIPSQPRRGRHLIEVARAHQLANDPGATLQSLAQAQTAAPETVRYNAYARRMLTELTEGPAVVRRDARNLAEQVGLLI